RRLGQDVEALRRLQALAQQAQADLRADAERQFGELRRYATETQEDLADLERQHAEHQRQVAAEVTRRDKVLSAAVADAERRRLQMETRIQDGVRRVDAKVEAERTERLRQARSQQERAAAQVQLAAEMLQSQRERATPLDLTEEVEALDEQLASARR